MPFTYPQNYEIQSIMPQLMARGREGRLGLDIFPIREVNAAQVRWTQQDNFYGLQQLRGLDGAPTHVQRVGMKTYVYEPAVFGEYIDITETELTTRAGSAPVDNTPIDVADLVVDADMQLINREYDRQEWMAWQAMVYGQISVVLDGPTGQQTGYTDTFPIQTYSASVPFSTFATAKPIAAFQAVQQMAVGYSVDFGAGAMAVANSVTINNILNNTNTADLGGRRDMYGATVNNLAGVNSYWQGQNLPRLVAYDAGYYPKIGQNTTAQFVKFVPDNTIVVIGRRPGNAKVGEYLVTRNASNGFRPGSYRYVIDRANGINGEKRTPANIEIHRGHSGGIALYFGSAIVVMHV